MGSVFSQLKKALRSHLRMLARSIEEERKYLLALLAKGEWFHGRAASSDYSRTKEWRSLHRPKAKHCYKNAQMYCLEDKDARYFEGYAGAAQTINKVLAIHHGWVVMPDNQVVDFTWDAADGSDEAKRSEVVYLGVHIPTEWCAKMICRRKYVGPVSEEFLLGDASDEHPA